MRLKYIYNFGWRKRKCEENAISEKNISRNAKVISFNSSSIYVCKTENIIINWVEISLVVSEIWKAKFGDFTVPVNIALV